jgi:hypothetical protein
VALVRTDVSEEPSASFIRVTKIGEEILFAEVVTASLDIVLKWNRHNVSPITHRSNVKITDCVPEVLMMTV